MALNFDPWYVFNAASGALLLALGAFVMTLRPRTPVILAVGAFTGAFGFAWLWAYLANIVLADPYSGSGGTGALVAVPFVAAQVIVFASLVALPLVFPRPWTMSRRAGLAASGAASGVFALAWLVARIVDVARGDANGWEGVVEAGRGIGIAGAIFAFLALALRALFEAELPARERAQLRIMSLALALYPGALLGLRLAQAAAAGQTWLQPALLLAPVLLLGAAIWLVVGARSDAADARACRNLALLMLVVPFATLLYTVEVGHARAGGGAPPGFARTLSALVLAYAILRHQLLGLDVRLRWTISKSSVAAVFIAVFFIASEAAQQFFGETLGSTYVGIAAAGALVFALAPLQRVAERLAEKAVPVAASPPERASLASAHADLLLAYAAAARDGRITHEEEVALARLATRLGLDAATVLEIRRDALEQAAGAGAEVGQQ